MSRRASIARTLPKPAAEELRKIGSALRAARLARNEPQIQLAQRLGLAPRTIRAAEHGNPAVGSGVVIAMMWALGLGPIGDTLLAQAGKAALGGGRKRARQSGAKALDDF